MKGEQDERRRWKKENMKGEWDNERNDKSRRCMENEKMKGEWNDEKRKRKNENEMMKGKMIGEDERSDKRRR